MKLERKELGSGEERFFVLIYSTASEGRAILTNCASRYAVYTYSACYFCALSAYYYYYAPCN